MSRVKSLVNRTVRRRLIISCLSSLPRVTTPRDRFEIRHLFSTSPATTGITSSLRRSPLPTVDYGRRVNDASKRQYSLALICPSINENTRSVSLVTTRERAFPLLNVSRRFISASVKTLGSYLNLTRTLSRGLHRLKNVFPRIN